MSVHRTTTLPVAPCRGRLIVSEAVVRVTSEVLQRFIGPDGRHEGLVFWAGRRCDRDAVAMCALVPACHHGPQHVMAPAEEIGRLGRRARALGLAVVAQVHSHPGSDTRHSDGDDKLVLMPHEGMLSLVVAHYGSGPLRPDQGAGFHQYQNGRWVQIQTSDADALIIVPSWARG